MAQFRLCNRTWSTDVRENLHTNQMREIFALIAKKKEEIPSTSANEHSLFFNLFTVTKLNLILQYTIESERRGKGKKQDQIWGRGGFNIAAKDVLPNLRKEESTKNNIFSVILYTTLELEAH